MALARANNPNFAAVAAGEVPVTVRARINEAKIAYAQCGQLPPAACQQCANCWTSRKKCSQSNTECCKCRRIVNPNDNSLNALAVPGPKAKDRRTGNRLYHLCMPCWSQWHEEHDSEACTGLACAMWLTCWLELNPMQAIISLQDALVPAAPPGLAPDQLAPGIAARLEELEKLVEYQAESITHLLERIEMLEGIRTAA